MRFNNRYFVFSVVLVCLQQGFLGASTWFIAVAGQHIAVGHARHAVHFIILFFVMALLAYLASSLVEIMINKLSNSLWKDYIQYCFSKFEKDKSLATFNNRKKVANWLASEAMTSLSEASSFIVNGFNTYINVCVTLGVFLVALGGYFTLTICLALSVSLLIVFVLKKRISDLARALQSGRQVSVGQLESLWDYTFSATPAMLADEKKIFTQKVQGYFSCTENYTFIEQLVSILPVLLAMPVLIGVALHFFHGRPETLGALVALLPRTLQLLGSVHEISRINSRIMRVKNKYKNMLAYPDTLARFNLPDFVKSDHVTIYSYADKKTISLADFMTVVRHQKQGRYLLTGPNGSGKSSLLKYLKSLREKSIYMSPETGFFNLEYRSTGLRMIGQIRVLLNIHDGELVLLDEWDANLDPVHRARCNQWLTELAMCRLLIEVRHLH